MARAVVGGLRSMGDDEAAAARAAYEVARKKHEAESKLYQALMRGAAENEKRAAIAAAVVTGGSLASMADKVIGSTNSAFADQGSAYRMAADKYQALVEERARKIKEALEKAAQFVTSFKWPSVPKPPAGLADAVASLGYADNLGSASMQFASPFAPAVGAFAADGLPDYTSATGQMRAYAAATGSLLDLFGDTRSLRLSTMQERALTLNFNFSSLTAALSAPMMMLEQVANMVWENARFERETALINRETAELLNGGTRKGSWEMARNPEKRKRT